MLSTVPNTLQLVAREQINNTTNIIIYKYFYQALYQAFIKHIYTYMHTYTKCTSNSKTFKEPF